MNEELKTEIDLSKFTRLEKQRGGQGGFRITGIRMRITNPRNSGGHSSTIVFGPDALAVCPIMETGFINWHIGRDSLRHLLLVEPAVANDPLSTKLSHFKSGRMSVDAVLPLAVVNALRLPEGYYEAQRFWKAKNFLVIDHSQLRKLGK